MQVPAVGIRDHKIETWSKPPTGWLKLNCDDSCRNNPGSSGGGGILRYAEGNMKGAFSIHFGIGTNNGAELKAIVEGVRYAKDCRALEWLLKVTLKLLWIGFGQGNVLCGIYEIIGKC